MKIIPFKQSLKLFRLHHILQGVSANCRWCAMLRLSDQLIVISLSINHNWYGLRVVSELPFHFVDGQVLFKDHTGLIIIGLIDARGRYESSVSYSVCNEVVLFLFLCLNNSEGVGLIEEGLRGIRHLITFDTEWKGFISLSTPTINWLIQVTNWLGWQIIIGV